MAIGDAKMSVDGKEIYSANDLRVGLFEAQGRASGAEGRMPVAAEKAVVA